MAQFFRVHPHNPQPRLMRHAADIVRAGGVVVYPTDSCYALGCHLGDKSAADRIRRLRKLDEHHHFTLVCRDLSELAIYAKVDNASYRLMRAHTPGPYTFILKATREVPRRLQHPRRRTVGVRVPENPVARALLEAVGEPMMSVSLQFPDESLPLTEPEAIRTRLEHDVELVIDGGAGGLDVTTVVDLANGEVHVARRGKGELDGAIVAA